MNNNIKNEILSDVSTSLRTEWGLQPIDTLSEEALIKLLAERIVAIAQKGAEPFFQLMYRLDISEKRLHEVIGNGEAAEKIARLIYQRQLEKVRSRHAHKQDADDIDPELKW